MSILCAELTCRCLISLYSSTIEKQGNTELSKRLRDLLVLMRSLIISPDILLSELSKDAVFSKSADQFYNALLSHEEMPAWEPQLLKSLLVDFATIVADCPKEYSTIPYTFTLALAYAMYKDNKKVEDFFGAGPPHL